MRKQIAIFFLFLITSVSAQDCTKSLIEYEKLNPEKGKAAFELESRKHQLGRVVQYIYYPSGNLHKETGYKNKDGKLVFMWEDTYAYNDNDDLIYESRYSEIPSCQYPELIEYKYSYPSDSLMIIEKTVKGNEADSTFIRIVKDDSGNVVLKFKITKSSYGLRNKFKEIDVTQCLYDTQGNLIQRIITDKIDGDVIQSDYEYEGNQIKADSYRSKNYQMTRMYEKGFLKIEEEGYSGSLRRKRLYNYNKKGQEKRVLLYENSEHIYSYVTSYNKQGLKSKYEMINESEKSSGIWLYEYDKSGKLIYKIDLYGRETEKKRKKKEKEEEVVVARSLQEEASDNLIQKQNPDFFTLKANRKDGFYEVIQNNVENKEVALTEDPFLTPMDFADTQLIVTDWGIPLIEIKIKDGNQKLNDLNVEKSIAFVVDNKMIDMSGIRIFVDEGKVHIRSGETLRDAYNLIKRWVSIPQQ